MKRILDHPFERGLYEELAIPTGEFVALLLAALMLLGLFLSSSTLPGVAKTIVAGVAATLSHASRSLGNSIEARASENRVRDVKERALAQLQRPTRVDGHHHRHHHHHVRICLLCDAAAHVKYYVQQT